MNYEKTKLLLDYLNTLHRLNDGDYRCVTEIDECIKQLRAEFAKTDEERETIELNAKGFESHFMTFQPKRRDANE